MRNVGNRLLALVDRLDQKFSAPDFIANVILYFVAIPILGHDVLVSIADAQMWNLVAVENDLVFAVHFFHGHISSAMVFGVLAKIAPGRGSSCAMLLAHFCTCSTLIPMRRAISGKRRLPKSCMCSEMILYSKLLPLPSRLN